MTRYDEALLVLRLVFGLSMVAHGLNKARGGIAGTDKWFASIGMRHSRVQAFMASGSEIVSGSMFAFGFLTAPACTVIVSLMVVAIITVHWRVGYFIFLPNGGWEYCASIASVACAVSLAGPGDWSLDHALDMPLSRGPWALPLGIVLSIAHVALFWRPAPVPGRP